MKNFKFVLLALFGFAVVMTSCDNTNLSPQADSDDSAFVDFMFLATTDDSTHTKHHNLTEIELASLPTAIKTYVSTNYAGATIDRAATNTNGEYAVHVVKADGTHVGLLFDKSGVFLAVKTGKGHKGVKIEVSSLPASVTAYITANYLGSSISSAYKHTNGTYGVLVTKADATKVMVGFDAAGVFVAELGMKGKGDKKPKKN
jgi:hypothetical protein